MNILLAGDLCQKNRVDEVIRQKKYGVLFDDVRSIIKSADYSIVNFEFPIVLDSNTAKPISKCGPNLRGSIESVDAVKYAGFNCCTLANNHILDQGERCCLDTKDALEKAGIDTVGIGFDLESAGKILYKQINGETLAVINCCEHEFSIATDISAGANPINPIKQYYKIQEARKFADYVLVIVHGGIELYQLPSPEMQDLYRFFIDSGADAVVNHHQHCYSGYEVYKGKPIFYGLGNFCFDNKKKKDNWNEGYMVMLEFYKTKEVSFCIYPYIQCDDEASVIKMQELEIFNENIHRLNSIIANKQELQQKWNFFEQNHRSQYYSIVSPFNSFFVKFLEKSHFLRINKRYWLFLSAVIQCESHRLRLLRFLKNI